MALVLIVDDHVDTGEAMTRLVRRLGPDAACVHSGEAALAFVAARCPSLVLMDLSMPEMDGLETLERLRDTGFSRPVVMLTAVSDAAYRRRAFELGAADYCLKSHFDLAQFTAMLARFVVLRPIRRSPSP